MIVTSTLSPGSLSGLAQVLTAMGLQFRERPLLHFTAPETWEPLDQALAEIRRFGVMALSSPRAANAVRRRMTSRCLHRISPRPEVWAAGPSTRAAFGGQWAVRVPEAASGAAALADALLQAAVGGPLLYPCGTERRDELPDRMRAAGWEVQEVTCYRVRLAGSVEIVGALEGSDLMVVGSHRILAATHAAFEGKPRPGLVCLGPATARTARALGWEPVAVASQPRVADVASAIQHASSQA